MNIFAIIKSKISQAYAEAPVPRGDRETVAFLRQHDARCDANSLPPAPTGISEAAMAALCGPQPAQRQDIARELAAISPATGDTGAELASRFPSGTAG
jgi:hypothetical protein